MTETCTAPDRSDAETKYFLGFKRSLWITKGARFEANRRLTRKNEISLFTISLLSIYVMAATLVPVLSKDLIPDKFNIIPLATMVTSIFILVLSHMEAAKNYSARAERMLRCAQKIAEIYNEFQFQMKTTIITTDSFKKLKDDYDKIILDYSENHANVDYFYFLATHRQDFGLEDWNRVHVVLWYKFQYHLDVYWFYAVMLTLPPTLVWVAFSLQHH